MMAAGGQAAQEQARAGADNTLAGGPVCSRRDFYSSRRRNQQVEVSWTEEAMIQRAELNHYLLMDAQRPAFMTEQQPAVLHLRRGQTMTDCSRYTAPNVHVRFSTGTEQMTSKNTSSSALIHHRS